jgi:hypothetical protein
MRAKGHDHDGLEYWDSLGRRWGFGCYGCHILHIIWSCYGSAAMGMDMLISSGSVCISKVVFMLPNLDRDTGRTGQITSGPVPEL